MRSPSCSFLLLVSGSISSVHIYYSFIFSPIPFFLPQACCQGCLDANIENKKFEVPVIPDTRESDRSASC